MKIWFSLMLLPSLLFADSRPFNLRKDPIFVEVEPQKIVIYPEQTEIAAADLGTLGNPFDKFLDAVMPANAVRYIILVVRPGSVRLQRHVRQRIQYRGIDLGIEPWETGRPLVPDELRVMNAIGGGPWPPAPSPGDILQRYQQIAGTPPCEVELSAESLNILQDNAIVRLEDLKTPGNAFECLLARYETQSGKPFIGFCAQPGGEVLFPKILLHIQARAPNLSWRMDIESKNEMVRIVTPLESTADGKTPVFFECRNSQLVPISIEAIQQAVAEKTAELKAAANNQETEFLTRAAQTTLELDGHSLDFTYALMNRFVLLPPRNAPGGGQPEGAAIDFGTRLASIDPQQQFICFFVRPDSFEMFRKARAVAWDLGIETTVELLDETETIMLGPGGERFLP